MHLYELVIKFVEISESKAEMWNLAVFCEDSAGIVPLGDELAIRLNNLSSSSEVQIVLRKAESEIGSLETKVCSLCEKTITGEFLRVFKLPLSRARLISIKISGSLKLVKLQEGVKNIEKIGKLQKLDEIIEISQKVDQKIVEMKSEIQEFYGVREENEENLKDFIEIPGDVNADFDISQDSDKEFLVELVQCLAHRLKIMKVDQELAFESLKFIEVISEKEESNENQEFLLIFSEIHERISKEIEEICEATDKSSEEIEKINKAIKDIREECEIIRNDIEVLNKSTDFQETQKEIVELTEKIAKSEKEFCELTEQFKGVISKKVETDLNAVKSHAISTNYELKSKYHELSSDLDDILLENSELLNEIEKLSSQKSSASHKNPTLNEEKLKENLKNICHESAKQAFDLALSIKDLETLTSYLEREIGFSKYKLSQKDSEHEAIQKKLSSLISANTSTRTLIEKELKNSPIPIYSDLQKMVNSYDLVLNEYDFLSNLTIQQIKAWTDGSALHSQLSQRIEDLDYLIYKSK